MLSFTSCEYNLFYFPLLERNSYTIHNHFNGIFKARFIRRIHQNSTYETGVNLQSIVG